MQHGIRRATHRDVQRHGIHKGFTRSDVARQHALVAILVVGKGVLHHLTGSSLEQLYTIGVGSQNGTIAGQRETNGLCQRVHGVGGKHA